MQVGLGGERTSEGKEWKNTGIRKRTLEKIKGQHKKTSITHTHKKKKDRTMTILANRRGNSHI